MRKALALLALSGALAAPLCANAALNFDFSFDNTVGQAPGTVTGEIFGLTDNATSAPIDVVIFSAPAAVGALPSTPWDLYTVAGYHFGDSGLANNFTVAGGAITATDFGLFGPGGGNAILAIGYGGLNIFAPGNPGAPAVMSLAKDITFTAAASGGVPEPQAWSLMICGFFGLGAVLRQARRAALA